LAVRAYAIKPATCRKRTSRRGVFSLQQSDPNDLTGAKFPADERPMNNQDGRILVNLMPGEPRPMTEATKNTNTLSGESHVQDP